MYVMASQIIGNSTFKSLFRRTLEIVKAISSCVLTHHNTPDRMILVDKNMLVGLVHRLYLL